MFIQSIKMAIMRNGILGGLSGKVGPVVALINGIKMYFGQSHEGLRNLRLRSWKINQNSEPFKPTSIVLLIY